MNAPDPFAPIEDPELGNLADLVTTLLKTRRRVGIAFSGGVDSSLLLALAIRALGRDGAVAIIGVSASLASAERRAAIELAEALGVEHVEVHTREGDIPAYRANGPDRCFHCKNELFARIDADVMIAHRLDAIAYGETADDRAAADRPGAAAASAHAVLSPLAEAGFTKAHVRALARALGLPNWSKPAAPCLASRIPHFSDVLPAKLGQVERAEQVLRDLGFDEVRVRHHGDVARVEVPVDQAARLLGDPVRELVLAGVREAGFAHVTIDLAGLRSGHLFQIATR